MKCILSDGSEFARRPGKVRDAENLSVVECRNCGLVRLSSVDHISESHYEDSGMHGDSLPDVEKWIANTDTDDQRRYEFLSEQLPDASVLDIGCGTGNFLLKARKRADRVVGIEPEQRLKSHFETNELEIYSTIDDIVTQEHPPRFDIITAFHVLEHVVDPVSMIQSAARLLNDNGRFYLEVPNADDALLTFYQCEAFANFTYWSCHVYLYNADTLEQVLVKSGMQVHAVHQIQRFPLANHLYWLANGRPGGHNQWPQLCNAELDAHYSAQLASMGKCDTIMACVSKPV